MTGKYLLPGSLVKDFSQTLFILVVRKRDFGSHRMNLPESDTGIISAALLKIQLWKYPPCVRAHGGVESNRWHPLLDSNYGLLLVFGSGGWHMVRRDFFFFLKLLRTFNSY